MQCQVQCLRCKLWNAMCKMQCVNGSASWNSWTDQLDGPAGRISWTDQLDGPAGHGSLSSYNWTAIRIWSGYLLGNYGPLSNYTQDSFPFYWKTIQLQNGWQSCGWESRSIQKVRGHPVIIWKPIRYFFYSVVQCGYCNRYSLMWLEQCGSYNVVSAMW